VAKRPAQKVRKLNRRPRWQIEVRRAILSEMAGSPPDEHKAPPCPLCQSRRTVQTSEHFGELLFFCVDCEHSWTVQPGKLPPRVRTEVASASCDNPPLALRANRRCLTRRAVALSARAAAARAVARRLVCEFEARQEIVHYLRELNDRSRAISESIH